MSLLAFASGFAKATGAAAIKEDDRRAELTKESYSEAMKRRDAALKIAKEQQDDFKKQRDYINSVRGMQVDGYTVSAAEASELYKLTEGDATKIEDVVKSGLIKIRNQGTLETVEGATEWSPEIPAMGDADKESSILFGSRTEAVQRQLKDRMGDVEAVKGAASFKASGIERGNLKTVDADGGLKNPNYNWSIDIPDGKGGFTTVQAVQSSEGLHIVDSAGKFVKPPEGWKGLRKNTTKTEEVSTLSSAVNELSKNLTNNTRTALTKAVEAQGAAINMKANYEEMAEYALDRSVYGGIGATISGLADTAKSEIAGLTLLAKGQGGEDKKDTSVWFKALDQVDEYLNNIEGTGVAAKRRRMEALALKLSINDLVSSGDSRPSDMDVKLRMRMYLAKTPEEFLLQAKNNMRVAETSFQTAVTELNAEGGIQVLRNLEQDETNEAAKQAAGLLVRSYTEIENAKIERPDFLTRAEEEGRDSVIIGEDPIRGDVKVTLERDGTKIEATYDPETDSYYTTDKQGRRRTMPASSAISQGWISKEAHLKNVRGE